jgi:hypothetical protein
MTKHLLIAISLFLVSVSSSFGQTKIEKYCEVVTRPKNNFTSKRVASISFGEKPELFNFKDSAVIYQLQKVNDLTTEVDVLNYMKKLGWSVLSINYTNYNLWFNFYFKKEFDTSELIDTNN